MGFAASYGVLVLAQAALVFAPGRPLRLASSRGLGLTIPAAALVAGATVAQIGGGADFLTALAAVVTPLLAAGAGWVRGWRRPWLPALCVPPLYAVAWLRPDVWASDVAGVALIAGACLAITGLVAGVAPRSWLTAGLVLPRRTRRDPRLGRPAGRADDERAPGRGAADDRPTAARAAASGLRFGHDGLARFRGAGAARTARPAASRCRGRHGACSRPLGAAASSDVADRGDTARAGRAYRGTGTSRSFADPAAAPQTLSLAARGRRAVSTSRPRLRLRTARQRPARATRPGHPARTARPWSWCG
jgi:hypothetical protein